MSGHSKWHRIGVQSQGERAKPNVFKTVARALLHVLYPRKTASLDEYSRRVSRRLRCPECYTDLGVDIIRLREGLYQCRNCGAVYPIGESGRK